MTHLFHNLIPRRRRAFTLFELLVVMGIMIALITAVAPSFAGLIQSTRYASAVNALTATLSRARSIAIERSRPTGVVFLFDIQKRKTTMLIVQLHSAATGTIGTKQSNLTGKPYNDTFVLIPAENTAPVELPKEVLVFGLSFHHDIITVPSITDPADWHYTDFDGESFYSPYYGEVLNHPTRNERLVNPWLLPRNDPRLFINDEYLVKTVNRSPEDVNLNEFWKLLGAGAAISGISSMPPAEIHQAVLSAHSYVIMFGSDGVLKPITDAGTVSSNVDYYLEFPDLPRDLEPTTIDTDYIPYDKIFPSDLQTNFNPNELGQGDNINVYAPNPEVMLRPADMLAVVELNDFIRGTAITKPWTLHSAGSFAPWPEFRGTPDALLSPLQPDDVALDTLVVQVSDWIDNNASIIAFDPNSGTPQKRSVN